jgi:hypothetical protein
MIYELQNYLFNNWDTLKIPIARPSNLSFMQIGSLGNYPGKISFLIFEKGGKVPLLTAKALRFQDNNSHLEKEYNNLLYVRSISSDIIKKSVPAPLFYGDIGGCKVLLTNALHGSKINAFSLRRLIIWRGTFRKNFRAAIRWLGQFNKETATKKILTPGEIDCFLFKPLRSVTGTFNFSAKEKAYIDGVTVSLRDLSKKEILVQCRHGNFSPSNILVSPSNQIGIIGWECFQPEGLALHDILFFSLVCSFAWVLGNKRGRIHEFKEKFFSINWFSSLFKKSISDYCRNLGIEFDLIPLYFFMMLVNMANKEYEDLCFNRMYGHMEVYEGCSKPVTGTSSEIIKDGLYLNMLRYFIANHGCFIFSEAFSHYHAAVQNSSDGGFRVSLPTNCGH